MHGLLRKLFSEKLRAVAYEELCRVSRNIASASECVILHGDGMLLPLHVSGYPLRLSAFLNELQARLEAANCGTLFQHSSPAPDVIVLLYASLEQGVALVRGALEQLAASGPPLTLGCSARCAFPGAIDAAGPAGGAGGRGGRLWRACGDRALPRGHGAAALPVRLPAGEPDALGLPRRQRIAAQ